MTIRIAASILVIFAVGVAPGEASARGGAFAGGRVAPFHSGFQAPMSRAAIAPPRWVVTPAPMIRPVIAPPRPVMPLARIHAAPFGHFWHRRAPVVVWATAPWYNAYDASWYSDFDAPWYSVYDAPWYAGSGRPWYSGSGIPSYPGGENPTDVGAGRQNSLDT